MSDDVIKSCPTYEPIRRDASGRFHLLITDRDSFPAEAFAPGTTPEDFDERWATEAHSKAIPSATPGETAHGFRSPSHLIISLRRRLQHEHIGFRLYAVGTAPFLWEVAGTASEIGLGKAEMQLFAVGSKARRLFCVHCRTISEGVTTNVHICDGCGSQLFVRDHFSKRLNAFMGFQIDAEVPGETIPVEEIYR